MAIQVYQGKVPSKAEIAVMVQQRNTEVSQAKAPVWNGKHNGKKATPSTKLSHSARKARIIARSIAADPKNKVMKAKK